MPTNLKLNNPNFVRVDGYFYHMDISGDTLYKKTDDGTNAFSYPLDTDITNTVQALQHDGRYFYTLENNTSANSGNGQLLIKRWEIDDFILKLKRTYTINGIATQKYNSNAFAIESFSRSFAATANSGTNTITLNDNDRIVPGDILYMGPSTFTGDVGEYEEKTVLVVLPGNQVQFTSNLTKSFNSTDKIIFSNKCWIFNKFRPSDTDPTNGSGQLYSFDLNPIVTTIVARKVGNEFRSVLAATYMRDNYYGGTGRDFLVYINQTNLLFIETDPTDTNYLLTVQSASQNNQGTDTSVLTIFDLTYEGNNIFRLQQKATFRTGATYNTEDWSPQYNYQLATLQRLPSSISLQAANGIISADGVTTTNVDATVRDQFDQPVASRLVSFTDSDTSGAPQGAMIPSSATTNSQGKATVQYRAGTIPQTVTVTSTT